MVFSLSGVAYHSRESFSLFLAVNPASRSACAQTAVLLLRTVFGLVCHLQYGALRPERWAKFCHWYDGMTQA